MRFFRKLSISTLGAVYFLILVGGIVRSTGSGMGCPDWPKCFGKWTPPTSVSELPENYKEIYSEYRNKKNQRFATYLSALGFEETAAKILRDETIKAEADFNPLKTWIEYLNRVVGVVIGILIFLVFVFSLKFRNTDRKTAVIAFLTFILVGFQGWIGSVVVSTNLTPWTITLHMLLAMVIVAMLAYLVNVTSEERPASAQPGTQLWLIAGMSLLLIQIVLGTQVRESVDRVSAALIPRESWVSELGLTFIIHRSFSWVVLLVNAVLILKLRKTEGAKGFVLTVILLILGTILTGSGMAWFAVPAFLQPVHLLLATLTFGMQFLLILRLSDRKANEAYS